MPTAYCEAGDLVVGNSLRRTGDDEKFIEIGRQEVDEALGQIYVLPLTPAPAANTVYALMLKRANAMIASGRMILSNATGGEDSSVHAYGMYCLSEGQAILQRIVSGQIDLVGIQRIEVGGSTANAPSIVQVDLLSPVDQFYGWMADQPYAPSPIWRPGS